MRVRINLSSDSLISLSTSYNRALQGLIYHLLDNEYKEFLHDQGYVFNKRHFKLFTFSKLLGRFKLKGSYIVFERHVSLIVSSPIKDFIENLCNNLLRTPKIEIEINELYIKSIEFLHEPEITNNITIYTLSPIIVYSTLFTRDNKKKTYYYSPFEEEFSELITKNLIKKYQLLNGNMVLEKEQSIRIEPIGRAKEVITSFKGTIIKGWNGKFKMSGSKELILTGYRCGLGAKNSAGFGMIEVLKNA